MEQIEKEIVGRCRDLCNSSSVMMVTAIQHLIKGARDLEALLNQKSETQQHSINVLDKDASPRPARDYCREIIQCVRGLCKDDQEFKKTVDAYFFKWYQDLEAVLKEKSKTQQQNMMAQGFNDLVQDPSVNKESSTEHLASGIHSSSINQIEKEIVGRCRVLCNGSSVMIVTAIHHLIKGARDLEALLKQKSETQQHIIKVLDKDASPRPARDYCREIIQRVRGLCKDDQEFKKTVDAYFFKWYQDLEAVLKEKSKTQQQNMMAQGFNDLVQDPIVNKESSTEHLASGIHSSSINQIEKEIVGRCRVLCNGSSVMIVTAIHHLIKGARDLEALLKQKSETQQHIIKVLDKDASPRPARDYCREIIQRVRGLCKDDQEFKKTVDAYFFKWYQDLEAVLKEKSKTQQQNIMAQGLNEFVQDPSVNKESSTEQLANDSNGDAALKKRSRTKLATCLREDFEDTVPPNKRAKIEQQKWETVPDPMLMRNAMELPPFAAPRIATGGKSITGGLNEDVEDAAPVNKRARFPNPMPLSALYMARLEEGKTLTGGLNEDVEDAASINKIARIPYPMPLADLYMAMIEEDKTIAAASSSHCP